MNYNKNMNLKKKIMSYIPFAQEVEDFSDVETVEPIPLLHSSKLSFDILQLISLFCLQDVCIFNWQLVDLKFKEVFEHENTIPLYINYLQIYWFQLTGRKRKIGDSAMQLFDEYILAPTCFQEEACRRRLPEDGTEGPCFVTTDETGLNLKVSREISPGQVNVSIRSDNPFPRVGGFCVLSGGLLLPTSNLLGYYEVHVPDLRQGEMISIGLCTKDYAFSRSQIGWGRVSAVRFGIGWHSDDSGLFMCSNRKRVSSEYAFPQEPCVVGVGLQKVDNKVAIFYTINGCKMRWLKTTIHRYDAISIPDLYDLYPAVGLDTNSSVKINLGDEPFLFKLDDFCQNEITFEKILSYQFQPNSVSR